MKSLVIHEPARPIPSDLTSQRLLSEDPREGVFGFQDGPSQAGINLNFAEPVTISAAYFGYIDNVPDDCEFFIHAAPAVGSETIALVNLTPIAKARRGGGCHIFATFPPVSVRAVYPRLRRLYAAPFDATGIVYGTGQVFNNEFRAEWGHEWGAGRPLDDTSAVERLPSGSFAIDQGVVTSGYQWTFGDLSDDERERLYDIHKAVGRHRSVLVIEDDDRTPGLYERMHWGLLAKLDTYARVDPTATTWNMQVADWL